jgi:hypothetical protein
MPIAVSAGIEKLYLVDVYQVAGAPSAGLLIFPGFGALAAFEIDSATFMKVFTGDLCPATERFHSKPLRVLLQLAALVLPAFGDSDRELRDGCALLAVSHLRVATKVPDKQNLLHGSLLLVECFSYVLRNSMPLRTLHQLHPMGQKCELRICAGDLELAGVSLGF